MILHYEDLKDYIPECCEIGFADLDDYSVDEKNKIIDYFPNTKTVIVVGHHILESLEWIWFKFKTERRENICPADLHIQLTIGKIKCGLEKRGYNSFVLPYPGTCGIMFKSMALKTGMGQLGDNFLFLHPIWGPWIHLRVLLTEAPIQKRIFNYTEICIHCKKCIDSCPGKAIDVNSFDGLKCNETQKQIESMIPSPKGYIYKCEKCVRVCPIGKEPLNLEIKAK